MLTGRPYTNTRICPSGKNISASRSAAQGHGPVRDELPALRRPIHRAPLTAPVAQSRADGADLVVIELVDLRAEQGRKHGIRAPVLLAAHLDAHFLLLDRRHRLRFEAAGQPTRHRLVL